MKTVATTSRSLAALEGTLGRLQSQLLQLGLNLSVLDRAGRCEVKPKPCCEFCQVVCGACSGCSNEIRKLAERVVSRAGPDKSKSVWGCSMVAVPVYQRRRLVGAAVACFPVRELLDEEFLRGLCDRLHLSYDAVIGLAERDIRHSADEADDFLRVLGWLLQRAQAARVSHDELETLSGNLTRTYEELSLLYRISSSMEVTQRPHEFLQSVCTDMLEVMNISAAAAVAYSHPPAIEQEIIVTAGKLELDRERMKCLVEQYIGPRFAKNNRAMLDNRFAASSDGDIDRAVGSLVAAPLVSDDELIGLLIGLNKLPGEPIDPTRRGPEKPASGPVHADFDSVDLKLISSIANQAAVFLANNRLYADLQDLLMGVLHALTATIDAKDPYTCGHSQRVALISKRLAEVSDFPPAKVEQIYLTGLLHDIGKIGVAESTLRKPGRLTDQEYADIKRHPALGAKILGGIRQLEDVLPGIVAHHERPDGKGYPYGLKGQEIPMEGLIIGLADSLDAMTSDRTYRNSLSIEDAIEEIRRHAGKQFDPDLVEKLLAMDLEKFMAELRQPTRTVFPVGVSARENKR